MKKATHFLIIFTSFVILGCGASNPVKRQVSAEASKNPVSVDYRVQYSNASGASDAVKGDCIIDKQLSEFIESYASEIDIAVSRSQRRVSQNGNGRVLMLEFSQILGHGGGAWSGAKAVTVKGQLYENGRLVGDFTGRRYSGGGAFGGFKGTCAILGRCVKALGKDIAYWLQAPTRNARLGDL